MHEGLTTGMPTLVVYALSLSRQRVKCSPWDVHDVRRLKYYIRLFTTCISARYTYLMLSYLPTTQVSSTQLQVPLRVSIQYYSTHGIALKAFSFTREM